MNALPRYFYWGWAIALLLRLGTLLFNYAFWVDMNSLKGWAVSLAEVGFSQFYTAGWSDYPPGYLYVLWATAKLYQLVDPGFHYTSGLLLVLLIKLTPVLLDMVAAGLIVQLLLPYVPVNTACLAALSYAFNPLVFFDSAVWGQVDAALILVMLLVLWLVLRDQFFLAALVGTVGVMIKPQGLFLAPFFVFSQWFRQAWWKWIGAIAAGLTLVWGLVLPFCDPEQVFASPLAALITPFFFLYDRMITTAATYPYASINAFNIWGNTNWQPDSTLVFGVSYKLIGLGLLGSLVAWIGFFLYHQRQPQAWFLAIALTLVGSFMLPTRMHERYIIYALPFLTLAAALLPALRFAAWGFTLTGCLNVGYAFLTYNHPAQFNLIPDSLKQGLVSLIILTNIGLFLALLNYSCRWQFDRSLDPGGNALDAMAKSS